MCEPDVQLCFQNVEINGTYCERDHEQTHTAGAKTLRKVQTKTEESPDKASVCVRSRTKSQKKCYKFETQDVEVI